MINTNQKQASAEEIQDIIDKNDSVLVFYHSRWSGPCNFAKDVIGMDEIKPSYISVDIDESPEWIKKHPNIPGVPYFEYYIKGQRVSSVLGITSIADLNNFIEASEVVYEGCSDFGGGSG